MAKELTKKQVMHLDSIVIYDPDYIGGFFSVFLKEIVTDVLVDYTDKEMFEHDLQFIKDSIRFKINEEAIPDLHIITISAYFAVPNYSFRSVSLFDLRIFIQLKCKDLTIMYNRGEI